MSTQETTARNGPSSTEQAKDKVQETAQQAAGQARGQIRTQVDQRSTQAGQKVTGTAEDVRGIAQQLREQGKDQPAKLAEQAADRAQRVGDYLEQSDGDRILRDVENFGRRQPWAVMFGGLAAGFLASRFLKASSSRRYESSYDSGVRTSGRPSGGTGGYVPPATTSGYTPDVRREPGLTSPTPGAPAGEVSLTGGVIPSSSPGARRPDSGTGASR
jgi:hypothetical protein